ncbi:MAG: Spy/CpxP family protein refolding chaperone [Betaproteobacteria bacterium]|jgi:Domain of Unknown Function (DUF1520).|nr:Spy/CpxP family protein refolding chaperone [Betaproteobacteria bacterium]
MMISRQWVKKLVAVMGLVGLSSVAQADQYATVPPPPPGQGAPAPVDHGDPVTNAQRHLDQFKQELGLSESQNDAWKRYAEDTLATVQAIRDQTKAAEQNVKPETAPQRFDEHIALMRQRLQGFERMNQALKAFYDTLTPEQKAIADRHFSQMRH